ncbi:hypothetical protein WISP_04067 [Willisornis vidua]|uniref:Uncharacterized protein n=1 Tax=Willisornis vidua TaxID=1566151 RepID=A0ABQ9DY41_9PASS|nr:hypothetical protein WISP_04067 [Willisornis vidua]
MTNSNSGIGCPEKVLKVMPKPESFAIAHCEHSGQGEPTDLLLRSYTKENRGLVNSGACTKGMDENGQLEEGEERDNLQPPIIRLT